MWNILELTSISYEFLADSWATLWIGSYRVFKTMVPFIGLYSAVISGVLAQSLYIGYQTIHECKRHPDLVKLSHKTIKSKIFYGSFMLGFTVVVFPIFTYWISLIAIQIIIHRTNNPIYRTLPIIIFFVSRFVTAEVIIRLFKNILDDEVNGFTSRLCCVNCTSQFFCCSTGRQ